MNKKETTKQIILYLIDKLNDKIEGKKKLMKLMFLTEHYDFDKNKLVPEMSVGNTFCIYYYGVFSREVMQCSDELIEEKEIIEGFPLKSKKKGELGKEIKERVDKIISIFGKKSGYDLENETLKMMKIEPYEKEKYFGQEVSSLIKK